MKLSLLAGLAATAFAAPAFAQSSLVCPSTSTNTSFTGSTAQTECSTTVTQGCTSKAGVIWDASSSILKLPGSAGNFQSPPGAPFPDNVFYATPADFDRDGWDDFLASNNADNIYVMRNQTITCGETGCTGTSSTPPTVQTISASWWATVANKRTPQFARPVLPVKASPSGAGGSESPMVSGDFDGDGWPDAIVISNTVNTGSNPRWPSAARLFLNTKNCHDASDAPCGAGMLCGAQVANGACSGGSVAGSGLPWAQSQLSCSTTAPASCTKYFPTFATYDLKTGAAVSSTGVAASGTTVTPTTTTPGDFGPVGHAAQNTFVVDWDGDGDLDLMMGHSSGTCPAGLCTTAAKVFYAGIDIWLNDCAQSGSWNSATKSCAGYIPRFSRNNTACTGAACANPDTLIPSTAHNTTALTPSANLGFDVALKGNPAFQFVDIDLDNDYDLVIGSPGCCSGAANASYQLRIYRGTSNNKSVQVLDTANPIVLSTSNASYPGMEGSMTGVFVTDFSGDGYPDIISAGDGVAYNVNRGGKTRFWKHSGNNSTPYGNNWPTCAATAATCTTCSATCNPDPTTKISESSGNANTANPSATPPNFGDFDVGFMLDYDHDPSGTKDMVLTNGNNVNEFYMFPNRSTPTIIAPCGNVVSGLLPQPSSEATVSGACITPNATVPSGTSITYYLTNEDPANYLLACTQTATSTFAPPLTAGQCCVTFPTITGRTIQWKAVMDSNTTDGLNVCTATGTTTPTLNSVAANYTYTPASQHYQAGVVVSDGVSYVGSFTQPGNRGHLYALAAGDGTKYYDFATKLDAQSSRNVYTTTTTATNVRLDFDPTSPNATLQSAIGASTPADATSTINWVLGPRFGTGAVGFAPTRLGAVQNSTPAVLNPPFRPNWYAYLTVQEKSLYDTFATTYATRLPLVLFSSMDGMIHAVISKATTIGESHNGTEAWGFIPPQVAQSMFSNYATTTSSGNLTITSYPDGSPSLLDFRKADGTIATAAVAPGGVGSKQISVLDVTNTIDSTSYSVASRGPIPLWSAEPGGSAAGLANTKPGVARTRIGTTETYVVVTGTGIQASDTSKGKVIAGYNMETGALLWQFEAMCALTSDITIFDTDDEGTYETNTSLDGFAERAVFADTCGYVYKLDPGQNLAGGWMSNAGMGPITLAPVYGKARSALFSTRLSAGSLAIDSPIVGTIGARVDNSTDMVLFFGTGGLESWDPTKVNEFYALYAKSGVIRNKVTAACSGAPCKYEKYYGGVVITPDSVIVQSSKDPIIGTGTCDFGSSRVAGYGLNSPYTSVFDITAIDGNPLHAVAGPLYGSSGALWFATQAGEIMRIGTPTATVAGADTTAGTMQKLGAGTAGYTNAPLTFVGWRNVL